MSVATDEVVVVVPDGGVRQLVLVALEMDGATVRPFASLNDALLGMEPSAPPGGIVLDADLARDPLAGQLAARAPDARLALVAGAHGVDRGVLSSRFARAPVV